jgi:hypothetical protein
VCNHRCGPLAFQACITYMPYMRLSIPHMRYNRSLNLPRPELYPVKKVVGFDRDMLDAIERWRAKQKPIPNVSDAIRRLVELGLKAKGSIR